MKRPSPSDVYFFTCEHGGNRIPARYRALFASAEAALTSHRGWDPGALFLACRLAAAVHAPLHYSTVSRLLVDLNRSEHHPRVLSKYTHGLTPESRERVMREHYRPYRRAVARAIERRILAENRVIHISVHSFTPVLAGVRRDVDIGLLYDPQRGPERAFAKRWQVALRAALPGLRVRMNTPYRGTSDGHTTSLRGRFPADLYIGIELEINQALVRKGRAKWSRTCGLIEASLQQT